MSTETYTFATSGRYTGTPPIRKEHQRLPQDSTKPATPAFSFPKAKRSCCSQMQAQQSPKSTTKLPAIQIVPDCPLKSPTPHELRVWSKLVRDFVVSVETTPTTPAEEQQTVWKSAEIPQKTTLPNCSPGLHRLPESNAPHETPTETPKIKAKGFKYGFARAFLCFRHE